VNLVAAVLFKGRVQGGAQALNDGDRHLLIGGHDLHQAKIDQLQESGGVILRLLGLMSR